MTRAVAGWSPVIMTLRMPARAAAATASATSGRAGSTMPTRATKVSAFSQWVGSGSSGGCSRTARAITRIASWPQAAAVSMMRRRSSSVIARATPPSRTLSDRSRSTSGAPRVKATLRPSSSAITVAIRRDDVNGTSPRMIPSCLTFLPFQARMSSAASVGSPVTSTRPGRSGAALSWAP